MADSEFGVRAQVFMMQHVQLMRSNGFLTRAIVWKIIVCCFQLTGQVSHLIFCTAKNGFFCHECWPNSQSSFTVTFPRNKLEKGLRAVYAQLITLEIEYMLGNQTNMMTVMAMMTMTMTLTMRMMIAIVGFP